MKPTFSNFSPTLMPSHVRQSVFLARRGREDAQWKKIESYYQDEIPEGRLRDLLDQSSLTHRLIRASGGDFQVRVLKQAWLRPSFSERSRLKLKEREFAFIREVELLCKGEVWVIARSVIPRKTLMGKLKHLSSLGSRPLGASLFKDPKLERTFFEVSKLKVGQLRVSEKSESKEVCWGRRSVFRLQGKSLLVAEIFLPVCPSLHNESE